MGFHGGHIQGFENLKNRINGGIIEIAPMICPPSGRDGRGSAHHADMVALRHAHRAARIGNGNGDAKMGECLHKGTHWRAAAMVHHGTRPIQNHSLDLLRHGFASISANTSSARPNPVLAPVPEVTETSRTPGMGASKNASSGPEG